MFLLILSASLIAVPTNSSADDTKESCPEYNFSSLFYDDYTSGTHWANKEITWSSNSPEIAGKQTTRSFYDTELEWIRQAIKSWDDALYTVSFKEISNYQNAEINIGMTQLDSQFGGYWHSWWYGNGIRYKAYIQISSVNEFNKEENKFIHTVQHEVGNVLGLGDIQRSGDIISVLEDPFEFPFGNKILSDFDTGMIRQLYGESTCTSSSLSNNQKVDNVIQEVTIMPTQIATTKNIKQKHAIICTKGNKKITMYRYNKDYPCLRGYTKQ